MASLGELKEDASNAQISEHKAKVFRMCVFAGERLKSDLKAEYNQDLTKLKGDDFNAMVAKLRQRYQPSQNHVLLHYQFHNLQQATGEKIDSFINRVCQHAEKCEFKCKNTSCTSRNAIHEILIRDQIVIGTNNTTIREQALEKELNLTDLISHSRKVEATEEATKVMDSEAPTSPFQVNSICDEPFPPTPINKIGKKGESIPRKLSEEITCMNLQNPLLPPIEYYVVLGVVVQIVTEGRHVQLNMPSAIRVERGVISLLFA